MTAIITQGLSSPLLVCQGYGGDSPAGQGGYFGPSFFGPSWFGASYWGTAVTPTPVPTYAAYPDPFAGTVVSTGNLPDPFAGTVRYRGPSS